MIKNKDHRDNVCFKSVKHAMKQTHQPINYIDHCCEIKVEIEKYNRSIVASRSTKNIDTLLYDGYLSLPEIQVIIHSYVVHFVNIYRLGREYSPELPGSVHVVVNKENTSLCYKVNLKPDSTDCNEISSDIKTITCKDGYENTVMYKCLAHIFLINTEYNAKYSKRKNVAPEDMKHSKLLIGPDNIRV